jgi:DNA adenine methylase
MPTQPDTQTLPRARPVIGWAGGKGRLLKYLLPLIPPHTTYCEVFGGGRALFCAKIPSPVEIINDINGDLVSFYRCCKYHLDPLRPSAPGCAG